MKNKKLYFSKNRKGIKKNFEILKFTKKIYENTKSSLSTPFKIKSMKNKKLYFSKNRKGIKKKI